MNKTKKQMIDEIENHLRHNKNIEVLVKDFGWQLRNAFKMHAYVIVSDNGTDVWCRPWAGANIIWRIPWFRMTAADVRVLHDRVIKPNQE